MLVTKIFQSISISKQRWIASVTVAILATLLGSTSVGAEKPNRAILSQVAAGIHLYGEADRPDVIGKEYVVFETIGNRTIGAFYLPKSEFSCFYGQFKGARLNVTLIDAVDRQKYNYTLRLESNGLTASKQPMMGEPIYQSLGNIGTIDRQILATCKLQLQNQY